MINLSGIWNVNSTYNVNNNKRVSTKLSFEIGEKFLARVISLDEVSKSLLLRLLDGWQFSADIENAEEVPKNQLLRFQVDGFENGKLKLKIVGSNGKLQNNSSDPIELFIKENSDNLSKEDYGFIKNMIKYEIPLTKDNISNMKTIVDFLNKIQIDNGEKDKFIQEYLASKNISAGSNQGKQINRILKNFLDNFGKLDSKDIFTFIENNINIDSENIKSFNNVFKKSSVIYNEIKNLADKMNLKTQDKDVKLTDDNYRVINDAIKDQVHFSKSSDESIKQLTNFVNKLQTISNGEEDFIQNYLSDKNIKLDSSEGKQIYDILKNFFDNFKDLSNEDLKMVIENIIKSGNTKSSDENYIDILQKNIDRVYKNADSSEIAAIKEDTASKNGLSALKNIFNNYILKGKSTNIVSRNLIDNIAGQIKSQVSLKTKEMSDVINQAISQMQDKNSDQRVDIADLLNNSINDFKIFNTISNSYYYMDLPLKLQNKDYGCRFMIKDERQKGKKIDSSNVKIAASISTENMGIIDTYLTIKNKNMHIEVKSKKSFIKLLEANSEKVLESLCDLGYNIDIGFSEKQEEMNISNCRSFFQDSELSIINTRA